MTVRKFGPAKDSLESEDGTLAGKGRVLNSKGTGDTLAWWVPELEFSSLLGTRYGDSVKLILGVLRCWAVRTPEKSSMWSSNGTLGHPLLASAWKLGHSLPEGPFPWLLSHGPPASYPSLPISPRGS